MPLKRPERPEHLEAYSGQTDPGARVEIKHPGYNDLGSTLIMLAGFDRSFGTISAICAIISGCRNGYFSKSKDDNGEARLRHELDDLLEAGIYYYHVPNDPRYAVYPSFEHWRFPHDDLPEPYTHRGPLAFSTGFLSTAVSQAPAEVMFRDQRCLISWQRDYKETCHLCPKKELLWFQGNQMSSYNTNMFLNTDDSVNDTSNMIALRQDLHRALDERFLVFVWKEHGWTTHFIKPTKDLGRQYHNMPVTLSDGISTQFLYVRLAWAVFPLLSAFLFSAGKRWVIVRALEKDGGAIWRKEHLDRDEIRKKVWRSQSPLKRKLGDGTGLDEMMDSDEETSGETVEFEATDSECWKDENSPVRGRRKRRKFSISPASSHGSIGPEYKTPFPPPPYKAELADVDGPASDEPVIESTDVDAESISKRGLTN